MLSGREGCPSSGSVPRFCLALGKRAVVGYEDGTMRIWDLKQGTSLHVLKGREGINLWCGEEAAPRCPRLSSLPTTGQDGHQDPLTCVASNQDGSLILTGSVDCHAKLVNSATGKVSPWGWGGFC